MKKVVKRFMVLVLVITLATCNTGTGFSLVKAEEKLETKEKTELGSNVNNEGYCKPEVVEEIVSDRTTDSTTFLLSNGMKQTTYYSDDIYFENEKGQLSEYDNEFVKLDKSDKKQVTDSVEVKGTEKEKYSYVNKEGDSKQFLPSGLSEKTPIVMAKENCIVSFSPADVEDEDSEENILSSETEKVKLDSKSVTSVYDGSREEKKVIAGYEGENKATELSYESLEHGLKETIILKNKPKSNVVSFNMTLQGCYAKVDETGGGITLYSEDDDIVGGMEAPFMDDATENNYSEEIHYELTEINEKEGDVHRYILKLVIDEKYLENATYPVAIDPTVTWNGTTDLPETYVLNSAKGTNYFSSGVKTFSVGKGSQGVFRTYFRAKSLAKTVKDKYIDSATLTVYENGSGVNGSTIYVKPAAASFKCGTVTWNNQPGGTSANLASFKSKGSADAKHEINLKTWAQNVAKGSGDGNKCYGLLFKAGSESSSSYVRFYGARASGHVPKLKVVYYDAPTTASAVTAKCSSDANRSYLKSGESLKVSWAGISAHALSYVQYRITDADGNTLSGHGYSTSTKIGTTASGNATINVGDLKDGTYKVYARGVDKGGITGTGKSATFHIDKVKPVFTKFIIKESTNTNTYSDSEPELTYSVKDDNFYCVQVSVNNGSYKSLSDDKEISGLVSGQANTIKVRAVDKAGNVSDVKSFTYYYDEDAPVISASINPNTNSEKMDNSEKKPVLKYTISDKTLKSYEVELNGEKINVNGSSGEVELKNVEEGENNISITATDKAGNEEKQELTYYRDTVTPEAGSVKVTPKTGFFNTSNKLPIVSWNGFSDDNLSEIQIKINDGEYKTLGLDSSGEGQLQGVDFSKDGKYTLTVRAVDKGGNVSKEVSSNYYYETADYELDDYTPVNVYAVEQIGGNTILRFSTKSGKYRDDVEYQVYRSETPNVVINNKTFVKSYASKGSIKVSGDEGITYYYKLRTVKTTNEGTLYSDYSEEISSTTLNTNIIESRMGQNSMYTYASVSTPNGAGAVELSKGNFLYSQEDISLPAPQIPVNVVRVYNSKDESKSLMGYGWSQSYDMYVSEKGNTAYFIDGTKAVYTFIKSGDKFDCNETPDMSLEIDDDILKRTITKVTTDQFGKESTKTTDLEIDTHYKVTTKNGKTYRFDDCGKLLLIEETNGTFVYISYDNKNGNIKSVETSKGQVAQYAYNTEGFISKITAAQGTKSEYSYSYEYKDGYMTKAVFNGTGSDKIEYKYLYEDGKLIAITDAEGNQYKVSYDGQIITKFTYPNRESEKFEFTENQKVTQPKTKVKCCNSNGIRLSEEEYYFSLDGLITEKTDAAGNKETYTYDKKNKTLITDTTDSMKYYALEGDVVVQRTVTNRENAEYDTYGNVTKSTDADGSITVYTYDYKNKIANVVRNQPVTMKTTDANGNVTVDESYEYDKLGNVVKEIDYITNVVTINTYGEDGQITASQELLGKDAEAKNFEQTALTSYDENTTYTIDGDESTEDSIEGTVEEKTIYFYNEIGNVTLEVTSATEVKEGLLKSFSKKGITVDEIKGLVKGTDIIATLYKYDDFLRTIQITEISKKGTKTTENKYNKNGSVLEEKDEKGRITKYSYDSMNRSVKAELIVGKESKATNTSYSYGSINRNNGYVIEVLDNLNVVTVTNKNGEVIGKTYTDVLGRTVREMSNGLYIDYTYDKNGRVYTTYTGGTDESNPNLVVEGKLSVSTYDESGNLAATIINPEINGSLFKIGKDSIVTKNSYDKSGNLTSTTDANGNTISYEYDEQGRILKVIEDGSVKATYSYDNLQKDNDGTYESVVETVTYANGGVAKTITNGSDQIISVKDETVSGNIETTYEYDNNGQVICEKYSDGSGIKYDYDVDGYQIRKSTYDAIDSKNAAKVTEYTYDTEGNILKAVDKKMGTPYRYTYYEYDSYGRNISVAEVNASSEPEVDTINAAKLKYVYNVDDNIEKIYYPNNKSDKLKGIQFVYNKDKWITEIDGLFSNDETVVIRQYVYHNDGKVKAIKDYENFLKKGSDFIERNYTYDVFDRVTTMKYFNSTDVDTILEQYDYQYDKNSNITYEHEVFNYENNVKDEEIRYTYNSLNQLTKSEKTDNITYKTTTSSYQYDSVGNRTYEGVFEFYTVDEMQSEITGSYKHSNYNVLNQLRSATRIESEDGKNVKTYNYSYRYDEEGNQVEVNDGKTGTTTTYEYDVENQLIYVRIEKNGTKVSEEHNEYNGAGQRIKKIDITVTDSGKEETKTTCYYYEGSLLLYTTNENGVKTSQNIIGNQNNAFATIRYDGDKQSEYFYSKDVQGSVTNLIDNSETCSKSYNYTDFGETEERFESEVDNEICYTGGVYDELTGLYYLNARYYDSDDGNFLSQDTYRGGNLYGYCGGNPISYIDPSGHSAVVVSGGAYKKSKKGYYYEFIETALCQLKNWGKSKGKKYWFIAKRGWSKSDKKAFKKQAKKCGAVKPIYFKSTKKLISKLNSKKFKKDKISDFTVFAHGFPGKITFGYNYTDGTDNDKLTMKCSQIKKISKDSFVTYPTSIFYSCRTAATDDNGKNNFAKKWNKRFGGGTIAFEGRTDYSEINYLPGYSWWDMHLYERKHGGKKFRTPARQLPTGINEKIYSNIKGDFPNSSYYCC